MDTRVLPINIPLPDLSGEDAIVFAEFLYQLAGCFEDSYRAAIECYYREVDEYRAEQRCQMQQLELFDDLDPF